MEGTMTFDDVLDMLGGMGMFQWFLYVAYAIAAATGVESIYSNFIGNWIIYSQTYICTICGGRGRGWMWN